MLPGLTCNTRFLSPLVLVPTRRTRFAVNLAQLVLVLTRHALCANCAVFGGLLDCTGRAHVAKGASACPYARCLRIFPGLAVYAHRKCGTDLAQWAVFACYTFCAFTRAL